MDDNTRFNWLDSKIHNLRIDNDKLRKKVNELYIKMYKQAQSTVEAHEIDMNPESASYWLDKEQLNEEQKVIQMLNEHNEFLQEIYKKHKEIDDRAKQSNVNFVKGFVSIVITYAIYYIIYLIIIK